MTKTSARTAAHFNTIASLVWPWFLLWSVLVGFVSVRDLTPAKVQEAITNPGLSSALGWVVNTADAVWVALAAASAYFALVSNEGLRTSRKWAFLSLLVACIICIVSAASGLPFGPILYTDRLGFKIAHLVSFGVPLLWFAIFFSSRSFVLMLLPKAAPWQLALGTALAVTLTDLSLEPFAWHHRYYWFWFPAQQSAPQMAPAWPPIQVYATWLLASAAGAWLLRESEVARGKRENYKLAITWCVMNAVFLVTRLVG